MPNNMLGCTTIRPTQLFVDEKNAYLIFSKKIIVNVNVYCCYHPWSNSAM